MKTLAISILILLTFSLANSQTAKMISGKVISAKDGSAISKGVVVLKGGLHFTHLNPNDGSFHLNLSGKTGTIIVSAKGYESLEIPITLDSINLILILNEKVEIPPTVNNFDENPSVDLIRSSKSGFGGASGDEGGAMIESVRPMTLGARVASDDPIRSDYLISDKKIGINNNQPKAESGLLTAGEVNDYSKWKMWNDIAENELAQHKEVWKFHPLKRYTVQIENEMRNPVFGAKVNLLENSYVVWSSLSDNTGKAELWLNPYTDRSPHSNNLVIEIEYAGRYYQIKQPKTFGEGINFYKIETGCLKPKFADIAFVVDATGSMGDEINYLKMDIQAIMKDIKDTLPNINYNLASVFYRDTSDSYMTRFSDFSDIIDTASNFIGKQSAAGGGDYPEAVHRGLDIAINQLSWREDAMAKVIFLVLDAPPHTRPEVIAELQSLTLKASQKGIRIIPLACSGVDKSTEYLLRSMALLTNGTYTFLTDDSGIGNPHIKPTTDKFDVETLKQVLVRLVYQYSFYPECQTNYPLLVNDTLSVSFPETGETSTEDIDESKVFDGFKYFPNPTFGELNIEFVGRAEELFIADVSGKIIFKLNPSSGNRIFIDLSAYPAGMYFIMYQYKPDKWLRGKIILMH